MIQIPSGSCTWSSGVTVPSNIGITITGNGTPNSTSGTTGGSASCTNTTITINSGGSQFTASPSYGNSTTRISCMQSEVGASGGIFLSILGTCTSSGCPNLRMDNITFTGWAGHPLAGISYGINAVGDVFGVIDHNTISGTSGNYLQLVEFSHASYLGVGQYGDNSWHQSEGYGSANFLFIENNSFVTAGCCENEGSAGALANQGGGRVVVRYNSFTAMDNLNFAMGWHGTESSGRPRSTRAFEFYQNTWSVSSGTPSVAGARGGTGIAWGNTISSSGGGLASFFTLTTYRTQGSPSSPWNQCDGSQPYDTNDGTTYYSGTIGLVSGSGPYTITVSGGSPGWTTNQWSPNGAPYSVHDVTQSTGSEITANTGNTLTVAFSGGPGAWTPAASDSIQILRATVCIDQAGGRGTGIFYSGSTPQSSAANEALSPSYFWLNATTNVNPGFGWVGSDTARVIQSREFYTENQSQVAQSSSSSPFDGTTTIGMGHGTLANRPTTCTVQVGYWATDTNTLYLCDSTNTWTATYSPYTYPHPLTGSGATSPSYIGGGVIVGGTATIH